MVRATDGRVSTGRRVLSALVMLIAIAVGAAVLHTTNKPWWVGSLAILAVLAGFWSIEWAVRRKRRPAGDLPNN